MSATLPKTLPQESGWIRIRRAALWLLFAVLLLIPKFLALRRRPSLWNSMRAILAIASALVLAIWAGRLRASGTAITSGAVLLIVLLAVLLMLALAIPPDRMRSSLPTRGAAANDALARQLGAAIVVRGGSYRANGAPPAETRLFVGRECLSVLSSNSDSDPLLVVPVAQISSLRAEPSGEGWKLSLGWKAGAAEFFYTGPFAEHFARIAESTVRSQMPGTLPIIR